jgi:hypothetical protein
VTVFIFLAVALTVLLGVALISAVCQAPRFARFLSLMADSLRRRLALLFADAGLGCSWMADAPPNP